MGLSITRTDARLGIETTPGKLSMESKPASLDLHQKQPMINIKSELPKVLIDQYDCFADEGLKNTRDLNKEIADMAYQQVLDYIGKTAEDGDRLSQIELGGSPVADIAERDAFPEHEFGLGSIPKAGPRYDVAGSLDLEAERNWEGVTNGVEIKYNPGQLNINYTPAVVKIYMKSYPSISISYQGGKIDTYV